MCLTYGAYYKKSFIHKFFAFVLSIIGAERAAEPNVR